MKLDIYGTMTFKSKSCAPDTTPHFAEGHEVRREVRRTCCGVLVLWRYYTLVPGVLRTLRREVRRSRNRDGAVQISHAEHHHFSCRAKHLLENCEKKSKTTGGCKNISIELSSIERFCIDRCQRLTNELPIWSNNC